MDIKELKINPKNPRKFDKASIDKMVKSITEFPKMLSLRPIVIDDDGTVLGGNLRLKALQVAGFKEIPDTWVRKASELTEEEKRRFIIADNVQLGEWDYQQLAEEWQPLELQEWGLPLQEPADYSPDLSEKLDDVEELLENSERITSNLQLGDLIEFEKDGEVLHKLLCGDSTNADHVEKLMGGEKADLAHNDPPYGMKKENEGVINDNLNYDDLLEFNRKWILTQLAHLKDNASWYCWGTDEPLMDMYSNILKPLIKENKITFRNLLTWDKNRMVGQKSPDLRSYTTADEKCLFVMCGVQGFNDNKENYYEGWEPVRQYILKSQLAMGWTVKKMEELTGSTSAKHWTSQSQFFLLTREHYNRLKEAAEKQRREQGLQNDAFKKDYDAFKKDYDEIKKDYDEIKEQFYATRAYFDNTHDNFNNVWHFERASKEERLLAGGHPTVKPLKLCERVIKTSCPEGGLVVDFFAGSGSTMVAAHHLKRRCYAIELNPLYCQVIIDRMLKLDNGLQILKNGNPL
jgi:DNA modification methylase